MIVLSPLPPPLTNTIEEGKQVNGISPSSLATPTASLTPSHRRCLLFPAPTSNGRR